MQIFTMLLKTILPLLAGLGAGAVLDKVAADKIPQYPSGGAVTPALKDETGRFSIKKAAWFVGITAVGITLVTIVLKKMKIKL